MTADGALGIAWTLAFAALLGTSARWVAARGFGLARGLPRIVGSAVLAWAWATLGLQVLGVTGHLDRPWLLLWAGAGLIGSAAVRWLRPAPRDEAGGPPDPLDLPATLGLAMIFVGVVVIGAASFLLPPKIVSDGPIYHLFFAAKWWKAGRVFLIASPFGENAATYFPANGDLVFAGLMTLFGSDRLARIGQAPFLLLAAVEAFAIARRVGAGVSASVLGVGFFVTCLPLLLFSFEANVDTIFVAGYLGAVYFGLRYALDGPRIADLILAGLAAGAAWGTKATASAFVPPLLLAGSGLIQLKPLGFWSKVAHLATLAASSLALCGFWFGRSLWLTGNPLYPLLVRGILPGWYDSSAMTLSQFYLPVNDWPSLYAVLFQVFDPRLFPVWVLAAIGTWRIGQTGEDRGIAGIRNDRATWALSALAILNLASYWLLIPYRTQQRFTLQALGLLAAPLARLLDRSVWFRWVAALLLAVHLMTAQSWPFARPGEPGPFSVSEKVPSVPAAPVHLPGSLREVRAMANSPGGTPYLAILGAIGLGSFAAAFAWMWASRRPGPVRYGIALLASFGLFAGIALADDLAFGMSRQAFPNFPDYARGWTVLDRLSPPKGTRVAYAGTNLPFYLMARNLRNDVFYVNIDAHPDWLLHDYHRTAADRGDPPVWDTPRPGWDRVHPDYPGWLANLRRDRIALLVTTRANPIDGPFNIADAEGFPIERVWADAHPESFELLYPRESPDPLFRLYRVRPSAIETRPP